MRRSISVQFKRGLRIANQRWINTTIRDISETGICINTRSVLPPSSFIRLQVKIPTERKWLRITGRAVTSVKQNNNYWARVRFLQLDESEKKYIRTYIAWVLVKEGGTP